MAGLGFPFLAIADAFRRGPALGRGVGVTGAVLIALAPLAAQAEGGPSTESIVRFEQAVAAAGCTVTELNRNTVLAQAEMAEPEAEVIVSVLVARGEATLTDTTFTLKAGGCAG